ncbi:alpha-L-fucosidase [Kribbella amoyensis]|uniref:alpha-L-fucosidase n=1 Tax=Kribbella amoyensis TaxID=996641 RepID=A0A561BK92_9ACTN|nr:alpha-L-fucosidase [Kribbella amoyensis]TWD79297.1 alpha-L-fucosidase [Kribbella amoyensis]
MRGHRGTVALLLAALGLGLVTAGPADAADPDVLNVSFGGSFSSGNTYTAATGEVMGGTLTRRSGAESLDPTRGVVLGGAADGIRFQPGTALSGGSVQRSFLIETAFTPAATQDNLATVTAIGGAIFGRYTGTTVQYGFSTESGGEWRDIVQSMPVPSAGEQHVLALAYEVNGAGATLHAFLDGQQLPAAISTDGKATWHPQAGGEVGIGNEVHPSALQRGLSGSVRQVRVASFSGVFDPADLELARPVVSNARVSVGFEGTVGSAGAYQPALGEKADPAPVITGATVTEPGQLRLDGGGIGWDASALGHDTGVLAETVVSPDVLQRGTELIDLPGVAKLVALGKHEVELRTADGATRVALPAPSVKENVRYHSLGLAVEPDGPTVTVLTKPGEAAVRKTIGTAEVGDQIRWLTGARGTAYGVGVSTFLNKPPADAQSLRALPCVVGKLDPARTMPVADGECVTSLTAKASAIRPDQRQVEWQRMEQTAFLHFGVNTFTGLEWGHGDEDPNLFQPTGLDTDQWARTLRDSGFKLAILTVKHHDGFLLYPSRYSTHSVASSSWLGGQGDVVRAFVTSMRKYGLKVGLYLSPADENQYLDGVYANGSPHTPRTIPTLVPGDDRAGRDLPRYTLTASDYGAYMLNQLYELLTEYGPVDEVWFDGAQGRIPPDKVETYDFPSWYELIRELAPQATIAVSGPDVRWVGNESGLARPDEYSVVPTITKPNGAPEYALGYAAGDQGSRKALLAGRDAGATELAWWPAESDVSIREGWFHHPEQEPRSVEQLTDIYYKSVGRNSVLLLNLPPDRTGRLDDRDVTRLAEWRARLAADMPRDLARGAHASGDGANPRAAVDGNQDTSWVTSAPNTGTLSVRLPSGTTVRRISLGEDIRFGQQVEAGVVEARTADGWQPVAEFGAVGQRRILALDAPATTDELRIRITRSRAKVHLATVSVY